jgi:very-short-patch-repair endonuclease
MRNRFDEGLIHGTLLKRSRELRADSTPAERRLWSYLKLKNLCGARFRRQYAIEGYIVDFCCLKERLIVELDGSQHRDNVSYDERRTRILEHQGFRVLRFWNGDVMQNIEGVVDTILQALRNRDF